MSGVRFAIAIDGPSGAGKSTVAKIVAKELGYIYVDTGAMYRSVALYGMNNNFNLNDRAVIESFISDVEIELKYVDASQRIFLGGEDVTERIRTQEVADGSSKVAVIDKVRRAMTDIQRGIAKRSDVVMDGRDIGTYVLPNAQVKIYMDAAVSTRAKRRVNELSEKGITVDIAIIEKEIEERDQRDKNRENSPLRMAQDAVFLDTSDMTAAQAVDIILDMVRDCRKTKDS